MKILAESIIIGHLRVKGSCIFLSLLTELNRGPLARNQVHMEREKGRDQKAEHHREYVGGHDEVGDLVVELFWVQ